MAMFTNGPQCSVKARDRKARPCCGRLHQFDVQMVAELDGTPVKNAPIETTYICEGHAPADVDDPKYLKCICKLCLKGKT